MGIQSQIKRKSSLPTIREMIERDKDKTSEQLEKENMYGGLKEIPVSLIDDNPHNELPVVDSDESMIELKNSIEKNGLREYPLVFLKDDGSGRYQMVYGHRRKRAHELLNKETIICKVSPRVMTEQQMIIANHDSNISREDIPIMARAKDVVKTFNAYIQIGFSPTEAKKTLAEDSETESERTIDRYRRLVDNLIPDMEPLVNSKQIPLVSAEKVSFLSDEFQEKVVEILRKTGKKLTISKAGMLKEDFEKKKISSDSIESVITGKTRQRIRKDKKLEVSKKIQDAIPKEIQPKEYEDFILKCIYEHIANTTNGDELYEENAQDGSVKITSEKEIKQKDRHVAVPE